MAKANEGTLVEIIDGKNLLLKKATRGISKGKWNGLGGKLDPGETPEECANREVFEESGLSLKEIFYHGIINFYDFGSGEATWKGHIFSSRSFSGSLKESDEGPLKWFDIEDLPWSEMWEDDRKWLPYLLSGKRFNAEVYFDKKGDLSRCDIIVH
jgi:8-oxo-dGTP diphosphatase